MRISIMLKVGVIKQQIILLLNIGQNSRNNSLAVNVKNLSTTET